MSRKVFTAGEVLAAADVNSFLMDQTVMSFAGTAARGSAIPTPVTGMTTYLEDTKDLRIYNGSAWASPFGSTLISEVSFTASSGVSQNNVFSSAYENYIIQTNLSSVSTGQNLYFRLRAGGVDTTTNYFYTGINTVATSGSLSIDNGQGVTFAYVGTSNVSLSAQTTVFAPFLTRSSYFVNQSVGVSGDTRQVANAGYIANATSHDGITFYPSTGTMTGNIRIYGMRNA